MISAAVARAERLPQVAQSADSMRMRQSPEEVRSSNSITLEELRDLALANNPTLIQSQAAVESARANWVQVGLYPNPNVAYMGTQIGDRNTPGQQGGYIEQQFVRGGKLALSREVAARDVAIAERDFAAQRMRVENDVRMSYYDALVAQRSLETANALVRIGEQALETTNELSKRGIYSRVEVLQAKIELNAARVGLLAAQNRNEAAWRRLIATVGIPHMQQVTVSGDPLADMPELSWEQSMTRILTESPELASSRIGVERAMSALRRAQVEPTPNITVQAGPQYDIGANHMITNLNVALPVPIFNSNQGNIRAAEAQVRSARAEVARQELVLTSRLATAYERYANARNQVRQYRDEILPDAKEALDLVVAGHRQGELAFWQILNAQRTYFNTNLAYLEATREFWQSSIAMEGLLLTDALQAGDVPAGNTSGGIGKTVVGPFMGK